MRILFIHIILYICCVHYLVHMQRNYKSASKESSFTSSKELSDGQLSMEASLFNTMETREIEGYPNYYISEDGNVFSDRTGKWVILKHDINWSGYHRVALRNKDGIKRFAVHRLVAINFIPNPENLPEVDHINFDRGDNIYSNLTWTTRLKNQRHSIKEGRRDHLLGEGHHFATVTESAVKEMRRLYRPRVFTAQMLADRFGCGRRTVASIVRYKTWRHIK